MVVRVERTLAKLSVIAVCLLGLWAVLPATSSAQQAPCAASARACLDLSANQAWLMDGGAVTYGPVPVTHGRPGWETPPGTFEVTFKDADFWSTDFDAPMPYSVFFNGGIAFHEGSLNVLSHGCVHLSQDAAMTFFDYLQPGDVVQVVP
ncbi:MAG: L,D-transpeptidase [Rhodococcus sp.]|nr:L,D-transpeptidase [Rhodococcus sp. (in: high G+C Gram-positive bacteria)]